jgi:flagellar motor protein MotB
MPLRTAVRRAILFPVMSLALPAGVVAQAPRAGGSGEAGGARLHPVVGTFAGRLDLDAGIDLLGLRAGAGFGELVELTGFYWRGVDTGERELVDTRGWGGEARLNLNAGFGVTPFVVAGVARLGLDTPGDRTAATAGAGLMLPLGPIRLAVAATDYILGISGLDRDVEGGEVSHNWLVSAGLSAALGRPRARDPGPVVAAPRPVAGPSPGDTVWATRPVEGAIIRNYQSGERIDIPLPLEGSVTIRYGPEPAVTMVAPAGGEPRAEFGPPATAPPVLRELDDAAIRRIIESTVAAVIPRLEAALAAERQDVRDLVRQELARLQWQPGPGIAVPAPAAPVPPEVAPEVAPDASLEAALRAVEGRIEAARAALAELVAGEAAVPAGTPRAAAARLALAGLAARHPALLTTAETDRGPAVVLMDAAFERGSTLPAAQARPVLDEVARAVETLGGGPVVVQGHGDGADVEVRAQQLSELRAEAVRSLLVQAGLDPLHVHAIGFGAGRPVASDATAAGRAMNRRVEIVVVTEGGSP